MENEVINVNNKQYVAINCNKALIAWARWNYRSELKENIIKVNRKKYVDLDYFLTLCKRRKFEKKTYIVSDIDFNLDKQIEKYSKLKENR